MEVSTPTIELTPAEREAFEERQRRLQEEFGRWAAAETLAEQERRADQWWLEHIERPRAARRISAARRAKTRPAAVRAPRRTSGSSGSPRAQAARSSAASGDSPDGEPGEPEPAAAHVRRLDLRDLHDRVHAARNHVASGRALLGEDRLGVARLEVAIDVLDALLADLRWGGVPA